MLLIFKGVTEKVMTTEVASLACKVGDTLKVVKAECDKPNFNYLIVGPLGRTFHDSVVSIAGLYVLKCMRGGREKSNYVFEVDYS